MKFKEGDKVRINSTALGVIELIDGRQPAPILVEITHHGMVHDYSNYDYSNPENHKLHHVSPKTMWWCSKDQLHPFVKLSKGAKAIFGGILNSI